MPTLIVDGGNVSILNVPYATLRSILFEKNFTGLPNGVTRQTGSTVNWVEFAASATGTGVTVTVNPNTVSQLMPD